MYTSSDGFVILVSITGFEDNLSAVSDVLRPCKRKTVEAEVAGKD